MLQTQTPGGEPTQSCQEKDRVPRDGRQGAQEPNTASILLGAKPSPRAPSPGCTDPVCHGPQQAVQVADQRFGWGTGLLSGQAGEGTATVVEGEVTALVGQRIWEGHREGAGAMRGPMLGCRSALTMCKMRMRASLRTSAVTTWERTAGDSQWRQDRHAPSPPASPPDFQPPRTHQQLSRLTVHPARALRCSAATSKAFRVAPPLPRRAQGSSTARRSAGGRGPSPPRSRRTSSSAKREAGGVKSRSRRRAQGGRRGARPATCLAAGRTRRHGPAGR